MGWNDGDPHGARGCLLVLVLDGTIVIGVIYIAMRMLT